MSRSTVRNHLLLVALVLSAAPGIARAQASDGKLRIIAFGLTRTIASTTPPAQRG